MGKRTSDARHCWREHPHLFRGAAGFIRRARWWGTQDLDQTHRLIERALATMPGWPPAPTLAPRVPRVQVVGAPDPQTSLLEPGLRPFALASDAHGVAHDAARCGHAVSADISNS